MSDTATLLKASIEIAKKDRLIGAQREAINLLYHRLKITEFKLAQARAQQVPAPALLKRQAG
jgi:hypothetical protein